MKALLIVALLTLLTACGREQAPPIDDSTTEYVNCAVDRFNVKCPNPYGGAL